MDSYNDAATHGARPRRYGGSRKRKGASDYAAENQDDFTYKSILREGRYINVLVCKFCAVVIGARSDRIKEHLSSKRHMKLKIEALEQGTSSSTLSVINARNKSIAFRSTSTTSDEHSATYDEEAFYDNAPDTMNTYVDNGSATCPPFQSSPFSSAMDLSRSKLPGNSSLDLATVSSNFNRLLSHNPIQNSTHSELFRSVSFPQQQVVQENTKYCLTWGTSASVLKSAFSAYQMGGNFTDVTLAADGKSLKCHKLVLSACSDYFFQLLIDNPCKHPIVILKDISFWELETLVQFMYNGEIYVRKEQLRSLIKIANQLQIRGLSREYDESGKPRGEANGRASNGMSTHASSSSGGTTLPTMKTNGAANGRGHANGMKMQFFPHLGPSSGGVCHQASSSMKTLMKSNNEVKLPTVNGEYPNQRLFTNSDSTSQCSSMVFGSSVLPDVFSEDKYQYMRENAYISSNGPEVSISKIPDITSNSLRDYPGGYKTNGGDTALSFLPQIEIHDSELQSAGQRQGKEQHNGGGSENFIKVETYDNETDSDSLNALTIAEDGD